MYKYETHCHTSEASRCGRLAGAEVARLYKGLGYDAIFVTDHFFNGSTAIDRSLPWDEKVELYCSGWKNAACEGAKIGLDVYFGIEYNQKGTEFLIYGADREFLLGHPDCDRMEMRDFIDLCHSRGYFCVQPHPFRQRGYIKCLRLYPDITDAVEIVNAAHPENDNFIFDRRAEAYAHSYGLPFTGGSDCHVPNQKWMGGVYTEEPIGDWKDYAEAVKSGNVRVFRELHKM